MSPENLRKLAHPELEESTVNIISVRKLGNEHTDRHTRNLKFFELMHKHLRNVSQKFEKDSSSTTGDIQR